MRIFAETVYVNRRTFLDEGLRRDAIAQARAAAARSGFRGRIQLAYRDVPHAGRLIAIRVWA